ncbi:MAG: hypothetical protein U1F52_21565 [Burkholderiales bacterium]
MRRAVLRPGRRDAAEGLKSREDNAFASRVILWQKTIDVSIEDAAMLAKVYTPQVTVSDDLLELLRREHDGNCRAIVNALRRLADLARRDCLERVDAKTWRERHGQASNRPCEWCADAAGSEAGRRVRGGVVCCCVSASTKWCAIAANSGGR